MSAATEMTNVPEVAIDATHRRRPWLAAFRTPSGITGLVLMCVVVALAVMSWLGLTPYNEAQQNITVSLQGPNGAHWFGTDQFGRDIFSRVAGGLADSLRIAVVSVAASAVVGVLLGTLAGYYQGLLDRIVGVITNVLFAFPSLLLALSLAATLQSSWVTVSIAIAVEAST
jgi:peptide/nickel transport system permease protein